VKKSIICHHPGVEYTPSHLKGDDECIEMVASQYFFTGHSEIIGKDGKVFFNPVRKEEKFSTVEEEWSGIR